MSKSETTAWPPEREAEWAADCQRWRGKLLTGKFRHWCSDWDCLPVDETTQEFSCCTCFEAADVA